MLTPAQTELYQAIKAECVEIGYAMSLFRIGVEIVGQDYHTAYRNLKAIIHQQIVSVRREHKARGRPLVISLRRDDDAMVGVQPIDHAEE